MFEEKMKLEKNKYFWWPLPIAIFCIILVIAVYLGMVSQIETVADGLAKAVIWK